MLFIILFITTELFASSPPRRVIGVSALSGRLLEVFNDDFRSQLDDDVVFRLAHQSANDIVDDQFTPNLSSPWTERTPYGEIEFGSRVYRGAFTTVFSIENLPNLLIKYQAHCMRLDSDIHPLLRDAWYLNASNAIGLSPKVHFISPPSAMCHDRVGKCGFSMRDFQFTNCVEDQGALRYMIMEKFNGVSLHQFRMMRYEASNGAMKFKNAIVIGVEMLRLIQKLQEEANIVHGDIHSPNVLIHINSSSGEVRLNLIDFGNAFNLSSKVLPETRIWPPGDWYHPFLTHWVIDGYAAGRRDDVLKCIQTIAHLMHPYGYFQMEQEIAGRGFRALQNWKMHGNWFITEGLNPIEGFPQPIKDHINDLLGRLLIIGRGLKLNERPPYEELTRLLIECYNLTLIA